MRIGLFTTVLVQLFNIAYGLVLPRMVILNFGSEVNGLMAGALQIVSLIAILEAGLGVASIKQLFTPLAEKDGPSVNKLIGSIKHYYLRVAGWTGSVGLIASMLYSLIVDSSLSITVQFLISLLVIVGPVVDFALSTKYYVYFVAAQRVSRFQSVQLSITLYKIAIVFICIRFDSTILTMLSLIALGSLLKWFLLMVLFRKEPFQFKTQKPLTPIDQRRSVFGHQLLGAVVYSGPLLYVATFVGATEASIYSINNMIFGMSYSFLSMLMGQVIVARLGNLYANNDNTKFSAFSQKITTIIIGGSLVAMASSIILLPSFLELYLGEEGKNYQVSSQTLLFALWGFINLTKLPYQTMINATGKFQATLWISTIEMCTFIGVLLLGYQNNSIVWVLTALLFSALVKGVLLAIFVHRHIVRQPLHIFASWGLSFFALLLAHPAIIPAISAHSAPDWILKSILTVFPVMLLAGALVIVGRGISRIVHIIIHR